MRAGALGDVLLLRPAIHSLRRAGLVPVLLAPAHSGSVLVGGGGSEVEALIDWERPDVAALLDAGGPFPESLREDLHGCALALVCSRTRFLEERLRTLIPGVAAVDPAPPPGVHAAAWYCRGLAELGIEPSPSDPPPLAATAAEGAQAAPLRDRLGARFVAVHPGSGSAAKNWPCARYEPLVSALAGTRPWLLVEGPADTAAAEALARVPGAVRARNLPLRVLAALLSGAALVVGSDSGVTHLAAACGSPTLALFGPTDPAQWAPVGPRVTVLRAPSGAMDQLAVEVVVEAARRLT